MVIKLKDEAGAKHIQVQHSKRRKIYLCGRCGQPKRGHVCPVPSDDEDEEDAAAAPPPIMQIKCDNCTAVMEILFPQSVIWIQCHSCESVWRLDPSFAIQMTQSTMPTVTPTVSAVEESPLLTPTGMTPGLQGLSIQEASPGGAIKEFKEEDIEAVKEITMEDIVDPVDPDAVHEREEVWRYKGMLSNVAQTQTLSSDDEDYESLRIETLVSDVDVEEVTVTAQEEISFRGPDCGPDCGPDGMGPMLGKCDGQADEANSMVMSFFTEEESLKTTPLILHHPNDFKTRGCATLGDSSRPLNDRKRPCPQCPPPRECGMKFCC